VSKTLVNLDDSVLKRAQRLSGIPTKRGVITEALEQMVRRLELDEYTAFVTSGAIGDLGDPEVIRAAQR
jgi:Arc/MetJ family transcription regulator